MIRRLRERISYLNSLIVWFIIRHKLVSYKLHAYKTLGNNISFGHPSVKHGHQLLRSLNHIIRGRVSLHLSQERYSRILKIKVGPGAGYVSGFSAYIGFLCQDATPGGNMYVRKLLQFGVTRNANRVPYAA